MDLGLCLWRDSGKGSLREWGTPPAAARAHGYKATGASGFSKQRSFRGSDFRPGIQTSYLIQTPASDAPSAAGSSGTPPLPPPRPACTGTLIYPFLSQSVHPTNVLGTCPGHWASARCATSELAFCLFCFLRPSPSSRAQTGLGLPVLPQPPKYCCSLQTRTALPDPEPAYSSYWTLEYLPTDHSPALGDTETSVP